MVSWVRSVKWASRSRAKRVLSVRLGLLLIVIIFCIGCKGFGLDGFNSAVLTIETAPLPEYLGYVFPEPQSTVDLGNDRYNDKFKEELNTIHFGPTEPSICLGVDSAPLMDIGDTPSTDEFLEQMRLIVDGQTITEPNFFEGYDSFGEEWYSEDGDFLFRTPDGMAFNVCWQGPLNSGVHIVDYVFTRTSGVEEMYSWSFEIVD